MYTCPCHICAPALAMQRAIFHAFRAKVENILFPTGCRRSARLPAVRVLLGIWLKDGCWLYQCYLSVFCFVLGKIGRARNFALRGVWTRLGRIITANKVLCYLGKRFDRFALIICDNKLIARLGQLSYVIGNFELYISAAISRRAGLSCVALNFANAVKFFYFAHYPIM